MAKITRLKIEGYRSIGSSIEITFPENQPVVLVGENNAGKSNIVKALQLVLGPFWPGNHQPDDHEFFGRDRSKPITIDLHFSPLAPLGSRFTQLRWRYHDADPEPLYFRGFDPTTSSWQHVRNDARDTCMCIVVGAERSLHYQLSYSSKWTYLSRLMHQFHRSLTSHVSVRDDLQHLFRQIKEKFHDIPTFRNFVEILRRELDDLVASMSHRLQVDFEAYNPVNFFHALRLEAVENGEPRTLDEMGTGEQQVLALAFAYAYATAFHGGIVLVIEEPEAHLHPLAQQWLARKLRSRCAEGLQVLITTHSPAFVSIEGLEGLVVVYKENGSTRVRQVTRREFVSKCIEFGAPRSRVTEQNILPFYAANATNDLLSGLFARTVVLVEGPTEALALPVLLAKRGLQLDREGIAVIPVYGKGNLAKWYRLYRAYDIPCYIVFDNDVTDDAEGSKRKDVLSALGVSEAEANEAMATEEWIVAERYTVFGKNYETAMRKSFKNYSDLEDKARDAGVDTKPFVARWVAEQLDVNAEDSGWSSVDNMIKALRTLSGYQHKKEENDYTVDDLPF